MRSDNQDEGVSEGGTASWSANQRSKRGRSACLPPLPCQPGPCWGDVACHGGRGVILGHAAGHPAPRWRAMLPAVEAVSQSVVLAVPPAMQAGKHRAHRFTIVSISPRPGRARLLLLSTIMLHCATSPHHWYIYVTHIQMTAKPQIVALEHRRAGPVWGAEPCSRPDGHRTAARTAGKLQASDAKAVTVLATPLGGIAASGLAQFPVCC